MKRARAQASTSASPLHAVSVGALVDSSAEALPYSYSSSDDEEDNLKPLRKQKAKSMIPGLVMKLDSNNRPCYCVGRRVYLEAFSPFYAKAYDFLVAIAEPVSRPEFFHEYEITSYSLHGAFSVGLDATSVLTTLEKLCKTQLPRKLTTFVTRGATRFGRAKLVLRGGQLYVESLELSILRELLRDKTIATARIKAPKRKAEVPGQTQTGVRISNGDGESEAEDKYIMITAASAMGPDENLATILEVGRCVDAVADGEAHAVSDSAVNNGKNTSISSNNSSSSSSINSAVARDHLASLSRRGHSAADDLDVNRCDALSVSVSSRSETTNGDENSTDNATQKMSAPSYAFQVDADLVEAVKKRAVEKGLPLLEEYDFYSDTANARLAIALKPSTRVRDYQEKALRKMFGNGRARSGTVVLPCGAGKTLVGVTAASTVRKSCVVLCTNGTAVQQWKDQFKLWTTLADTDIVCFTALTKLSPQCLSDASKPVVLITTYSMLAQTKRSDLSAAVVEGIQSREWGLMLLDEVHVVPAATFRKVLSVCHAHCKLGLTATLVREDDKIGDLTWLIGPKLFEANWLDLTRAGHLARVRCEEVRCAMPREFFREYLRCRGGARQKRLLGILNPAKFRACEFLLRRHEAAGDKILVFSDDVLALKTYAQRLNIPYIYGDTKEQERSRVFSSFRHSATVNTLAVSKIGDVAIDLPEANVLIQVSSHFGSRRQEAQRLGRILRPKASRGMAEFNAFFYSLVSEDTHEMYYSGKRQQFLVDQGYSFFVLQGHESSAVTQRGDDGINSNNSSAITSRMPESALATKAAELALLEEVLCANLSNARAESRGGGTDGYDDDDEEAEYALAEAAADAEAFAASTRATSATGPFSGRAAGTGGAITGTNGGQALFQRTARSIAVLTGADDDVYYEFGDGNEYEE